MTAVLSTSDAPMAQPPASPARPRRARSWRWLRLAIPFAVVIVFWLASYASRSWDNPNLGDPGSLSPTGTGRFGSSTLAGTLTRAGITIERVTSSADAVLPK